MTNLYQRLSKERKEKQAAGEYPQWFTSPSYQIFKEKYLYEAESFKEQANRIAATAAKHTKSPKVWQEKFFEVIWNGWLSCATPVLSNMGTNRGLPVSCSGQYIHDSIDGFYKNRHETALLTKYGFGTSGYLGDIRPRGSDISVGGKASGVLPVIKGFVQDMREVSQGGVRRGSWAGSLPIAHGDFYEVCDYLKDHPDDLNLAWLIYQADLDALEAGDEDMIARFKKVMKTKMLTGKGYFTFPDKANDLNPSSYLKNGLAFKASNLCVTGDQLVPTSWGMVTVSDLFFSDADYLRLHDGQKEVTSSPMKLMGTSEDVYEIELENGLKHKVTDYHKVLTDKGMVECKDLSVGDKVAFQKNKGIFGKADKQDEAFLAGHWLGDGTSSEKQHIFALWENDFDLQRLIEEKVSRVYQKYGLNYSNKSKRHYETPTFFSASPTQGGVKKKVLASSRLESVLELQKGIIPSYVMCGTEETQWAFIKGLFCTDGTVNVTNGKGNPLYLSITSVDKQFLEELQLILLNLGLSFSLKKAADAGIKLMPDGKGGKKEYFCKDAWRLVCGNKPDALVFERNTGFLTRKGVKIENRQYRDNSKKFSKVRSVTYAGKEDVFCVKVDSEESLWVCNGFITSNCQEIFLHSDEDHSYTCVLSSMNLAKYDEWKDTDAVFVATVFLDCVAQEFIEKAKKIGGLEKAIRFTEKGRALGLGVMGWHTYLQQKSIAFESFEAHNLNQVIFKHIQEESKAASAWMGKEFGEPEWCKGTGMRNTHTMAIAPTMSTALIMGGVSQGIEPIIGNAFIQNTSAGEIERVNPCFLKIARERGKYNKELIKDVAANYGSVQHLPWLSDHEKLVLRTAFEINQEVIIRQASQRQKYIDQGQSLNLFFSADESEAEVARIHKIAFLDPMIKSLYYVRTQAGVAGSKGECVACGG